MHAGPLSLDAFLNRRSSDRRLARLTHDVGLPEGFGLEFVAEAGPMPLPEGLKITYVGRAAGADRRPYDTPIDHVWTGADSLATGLGRVGYDFAIAAQIAHRIPNLLGWFRGIYAVLRPGGVLNLALPDRRYTVDLDRQDSTIAELVEADLLAAVRPSPRQVFAHTYEARAIDPGAIWEGADPASAPRLGGEAALDLAFARATADLDDDPACHCWVFTPLSGLDVVEAGARLGLFPFVLNQMAATDPGGSEFFVSMRRDAQDSPEPLRTLQEGAIAHLRAILQRQRRNAELIARS
jgi:hypothetical protein